MCCLKQNIQETPLKVISRRLSSIRFSRKMMEDREIIVTRIELKVYTKVRLMMENVLLLIMRRIY